MQRSARASRHLPEPPHPHHRPLVGWRTAGRDDAPWDVVPRLAKALRTALDSDTVKQRFRSDAAEPGAMSPEEFTRFLKEDAARTEKVVADLGYAKE